MVFTRNRIFILTQVLLWTAIATTSFGQSTPPKQTTDLEFVELLNARMKQVDELRDVNETTKAKLRELYKQALQEMESARGWNEKYANFEGLANRAPGELNQAKTELTSQPVQPVVVIPPDMALPQMEQVISKGEANLESWRTVLAAVEGELNSRVTRRAEISKLVTTARERLTEVNTEIQSPSVADDKLPEVFARRMMLLARQRNLMQEIASYDKELAAYDAQTELLPVKRELHVRRIAIADQEIKLWQKLVNDRRKEDAEQQAQQAQQARQASIEAGQAPQAAKKIVEENAALAGRRTELASQISDASQQLELVKQRLVNLNGKFKRAKEIVDAVGQTNTEVGRMLRGNREDKEMLPDVGAHRRNISDRRLKMENIQLERLKMSDERSTLLTALASPNMNVEPAVREAMRTKDKYLKDLIGDYDVYLGKLSDLNLTESQWIKTTEEFAQFIDERVLWISSAPMLGEGDLRQVVDAARWLCGPEACMDIGRTLLADARRNSAVSSLALVVFSLLIYWRLKFKARIQEISLQVSKGSCYRFLPTLETSMLTVLSAVAWPGLTWYLGWRLQFAAESAGASELCGTLGKGLSEISRVFFALEMLRHTCCQGGLAEAHFAWSPAALKSIRQNIRWFSTPMLALMCVAVTMAWQGQNGYDVSLGRICYMAALLCFSLVLYRILRPSSVVFQAIIADRRGGWLDRFRYVWYPLVTLTPVALVVLAFVGYHYTSRQLIIRLILTTYVLVGGAVCRSLFLRWILVNQRRLAIEQARQRRAAAAHSENAVGDDAAAELPAVAAPDRDLATINAQTRRLIEYSLAVACTVLVWSQWIDVLPALGILREIAIPHSGLTLADLGVAAIVLATTVIAAKNIPGLLEMVVLQHLPLDAGSRYAAATVSRYAITIIGTAFCCGALKITWDKAQWLAAAISLGLGFGLQEIFANFVSGLIILFERPVRVGDVVTIADVSGIVSRIRMRATTITDWDRKELIIPNKEFITGRVLNWTLSDPVNRVVVNVGIAYGSDTKLAGDILMKIAREHQHVLADPPPMVMLESFGDSALNFVLRCFLPNLENRGTVIHELHVTIEQSLREAGIEIAFPQQDVHVRSIDLPASMLQSAMVGGSMKPSPKPTVDRAA